MLKHKITQLIRKTTGQTKAEFAKNHKINLHTMNLIISGERNSDVGEGLRIRRLLEDSGCWSKPLKRRAA